MSWLKRLVHVAVLVFFIHSAISVEDKDKTSEGDTQNHANASIQHSSTIERGLPQDYNADVSKILNILINNLYTNRDIFLREVISNGSDALDKVRFLYLTDAKSPRNQDGDEPTLDIHIRVDHDSRTLTIRDGGVGMTKTELSNNLGMLGASGTKAFLEKVSDTTKDAGLIGQFGVGFYSIFLVVDTVRVSSKSDQCDTQWTWESSGDGKFFLYEDPNGNTLGRGTELTLHLKQDADEFLGIDYIKDTVLRYSEFIHFPIFLEVSETKRVLKSTADTHPEDADAREQNDDNENDSEEDISVSSELEDDNEGIFKKASSKSEPEYEEVEEKRWQRINENEPIWTRPAAEVIEEEYNKFYHSMTQDKADPLYYAHFKAEGDVDFNSILYIPVKTDKESFAPNASINSIRLYVRRVFITNEFKDLLPRYLSFVHGVVDSDDLPLNVSRELLQENRVLKIIKKKLLRKVLSMIAEIANQDQRLEAENKTKAQAEQQQEEDEEDKSKEQQQEMDRDTADTSSSTPAAKKHGHKGNKVLKTMTYSTFWETFGTHIRLGVVEDATNRNRLLKLLRYKTSKHEDKFSSLDEYIERMPETQTHIFFATGESIEHVKALPVVEDALKRDVEVLFMTDPIDEYVIYELKTYSGKKLANLAKEGVKLAQSTPRDRKIAGKRKEKYDVLLKWFKNQCGESVSKVMITQRMTSEPVIVTSSEWGTTAMMAQILKHQTLTERKDSSKVSKILEINHLHPVIDELHRRVLVDENDVNARSAAQVLFATASLQSGFEVEDVKKYAAHVDSMVRSGLEVTLDAGLIDEDVSEYEIEAAEDDSDEVGEELPDLAASLPPGGKRLPIQFNMGSEGDSSTQEMTFDLDKDGEQFKTDTNGEAQSTPGDHSHEHEDL